MLLFINITTFVTFFNNWAYAISSVRCTNINVISNAILLLWIFTEIPNEFENEQSYNKRMEENCTYLFKTHVYVMYKNKQNLIKEML